MSGSRRITCVNCPLGCRITVEPGPERLTVSGHECKQGKEYALQEYADPRRSLTGTVRVENGFLKRLPVKTASPIPRDMVAAAARALDNVTVRAPVKCGTVIARNLAGSGVNIVATRDLKSID